MVNYDNAGAELLALLDKEHLTARDVAELEKVVPHCDGELRRLAAESLGRADPGEAWPLLCRLAGDGDWLVRTEACQSLGENVSEQAAGLLLNKARQDPEETVRVYAVCALGEMLARRDPGERKQWAGALEELAKEPQGQRLRLALCEALYRAEPREDRLAGLLEGLQSEDYTVRCSALNGLGAVLDRENCGMIRTRVLQLKETEPTPAVLSTIGGLEEAWTLLCPPDRDGREHTGG